MSKVEELLKLMKDNPDLPIVPMVNYEVVGEDGSLVLADDCGNITYCDTKRFMVEPQESEKSDDYYRGAQEEY